MPSNTPNQVQSPKLDMKAFIKYGMEYFIYKRTDLRKVWRQVVRHAETGEEIDTSDKEELSKYATDTNVTIQWEETDEFHPFEQVESVEVRDLEAEYTKKPCPLYLFSTPDGPLLGIVIESTDEDYKLLDPCIVQYVKQRIQLFPIFNVARTMVLKKHAVKSVQAPSELIVACYPGFVVQNKMAKYQLKLPEPLASTPEVDNEAKEPETIKTVH